MNNFSIIIPVYNEADNINSLYAEIIESIPKNFNYEIIFINDHSTDDTNIVLDKLSKKKFPSEKILELYTGILLFRKKKFQDSIKRLNISL